MAVASRIRLFHLCQSSRPECRIWPARGVFARAAERQTRGAAVHAAIKNAGKHIAFSFQVAGIVILGAILVYVKGAALLSAWRVSPAMAAAGAGRPNTVFSHGACTKHHEHGSEYSHFHAPDPSTLSNGFSWKSALLTMVAAGLRPCSGAILVLVFALAQGIFPAGVVAVAAMSLGTTATTSALASTAVFAKNAAVKYAKPDSRWALIAGHLFEAIAAFAVLGLGLALLSAAFAGVGGAN